MTPYWNIWPGKNQNPGKDNCLGVLQLLFELFNTQTWQLCAVRMGW